MQMMMFQYLHTVYTDDGDSVFLLNIEMMMFQYSHTEVIDDDDFSIPILNI